MSLVLGNIILPPTPKLGSLSLPEYQQNVSLWTRQAEQTVRQIERFLRSLSTGPSLPNGGTTGQVLEKNSSTNGDASWQDIHQVPAGGSTSQVLTKNSSTNYDTSWQSAATGVPTGGTTGQALRKNSSTNFDDSWLDVHEVPAGGSTSQALRKNSGTNYDEAWQDVHEVPAGGSTNQVLTKNSATNYDTVWTTPTPSVTDVLQVQIFS